MQKHTDFVVPHDPEVHLGHSGSVHQGMGKLQDLDCNQLTPRGSEHESSAQQGNDRAPCEDADEQSSNAGAL